MRIDLTCPVELWHFKMPSADYPVVALQLFNLSDKTVTSLQAAFACFDAKGESLSRQVERVQGLVGEPKSAFEVAVAVEDGVRAANMDFVIEKVWFHDGTVWRRGAGNMTEYEPNALPSGRQLDVLRHVAGHDAVGYPSDQGALWVCVCGRPTAASRSQCSRCGREKHELFTRYNKAAIEKIIFQKESEMEEKAHHAREEAGRMQNAREEKETRTRKKRRRIISALAALLLLSSVAAAGYFFGLPALRYYLAGQKLKAQKFDEAKQDYLALREYRDSASLVQEADYRKAVAAAQGANLTALKSAQDMYEALGDYRDSAQLARQMRYQRAQLLESSRDYAQAIALYQEITGYQDAQARIPRLNYQWAKELMDALDYSASRQKFLALGNYEDAAQQAQQALFLPALAHMERQEYRQAIDLFSQLPEDYPNAHQRIQESYYGWGEQLFGAKAFDEAAEKYLKAEGYADATLKASQSLYTPAVQMMQEGQYAAAKERFDKIPFYEDSAQRAAECAYQLGVEAMSAAEYEKAIGFFAQAKDHADAKALAQQANYALAQQLLAAGQKLQALPLLDAAQDYQDAAALAKRARYDLGIEAANAGQFDQAIEYFTSLGDYESSAEELLRAKYNRAISLLEAENYQQAEAAFAAIENYASSSRYLKQARYALARQLLQKGDLAAAAQAFQALGDYEDAATQYQESIYQQALAALQQKDLAGAAALLEPIAGYKDAGDLFAGSIYQLAQQLQAQNRLGEAAEQFARIPTYQDAAQQSEATYDTYYADAYNQAVRALAQRDYKTVVDILEPLDKQNPGEKYAGIQKMYNEAAYAYANQLYEDNKPYEALAYYRKVLTYGDVADRKLTRTPYRIIGEWETEKGLKMEFRDNGTCRIDGRELYYWARNYLLKTGDRPEELNTSYSIVRITEDALTLKNLKTKTYYKLTRTEQ